MNTIEERLARLVHAVGAELTNTERPVHICRHVISPGFEGPISTCGIHPAGGMLCLECLVEHLHAHGEARTLACALCDRSDVETAPSSFAVELGGLMALNPKGIAAVLREGARTNVLFTCCRGCRETLDEEMAAR